MTIQCDIDKKVMECILRHLGGTMDDVALDCPDLTWNQVFITIDRLSREGTVTLTPQRRGVLSGHLPSSVRQRIHA